MRRLEWLPILTALVLAASCGESEEQDTGGTVTVFAASSLTDAFTEIGADFEAATPGTSVEFNFASSSDLADAIASGEALGTADVFASADQATMDVLVEAEATGSEPVVFAQNQAEIAVPPGNPGNVEGLADLAEESIFVGLCAENVPCGAYAREVLRNAGVEASVDTNEAKVTDVVDKLVSGDLDAGIVYVSDVVAAGDQVEAIPIPEALNVLAEYPIATVTDSDDPDLADTFVAFVQSTKGRRALEEAGFLIPG